MYALAYAVAIIIIAGLTIAAVVLTVSASTATTTATTTSVEVTAFGACSVAVVWPLTVTFVQALQDSVRVQQVAG